MKVNSYTEWGNLKEIIIGDVSYAQIPTIKNHDIHCVDYANYEDVSNLPSSFYPKNIIEETQEDLNMFSKTLTDLGIVVHRPKVNNYSKKFSTPNWVSDGYYGYCPRDSAIVIGDTIIETPMVLRARYFETFPLREIFKNYFLEGSRWLASPKPELLDDLYDRSNLDKPTLTDFEPAFDAANIIKCGADIFYLVSNSGNYLGAKWLQSVLGEKFTVNIIDDIYAYVHLDTSIMPLCPGKVLLNPDRVNPNNLPKYFKNWHKIYAEAPKETEFLDHYAPASPWIGMNILSIDPSTVVVEKRQVKLIKQLEKEQFTVIPVSLRHCRTLSGGPHCVTLDTVRNDSYERF